MLWGPRCSVGVTGFGGGRGSEVRMPSGWEIRNVRGWIELSEADRSGCAGGQTENPALRRGRPRRAAQGQRGGGRSPHTRRHRRSLLSPSRAKVFLPDAPRHFALSLVPSGTLAAGSASERAPWLRRLQVHSRTRRWGPSEEDLTWGVCALACSFPRRVGEGTGRPWRLFGLWCFWRGMGDAF